MSRRLKVLLSAYACEPDKGSEPGVGWNCARQMARWHDVWVLTRSNNRTAIEGQAAKDEERAPHWAYFDLPRWARFWKKGARGVQVYYYLWQLGVWRTAARLHRQVGFDLVHHITFGKYWVPSFLALLRTKVILGPLGGGESTPPALAGTFGTSGKRYERSRNLVRRVGGLDPVLRATLRRASLVLATTEESKTTLERLGATRVLVEPQIAMDDAELDLFGRIPVRTQGPFRLISIGRLLHWKGFHLSLQAFARFSHSFPESEYWLINDGPEERALKQLAAELRVSARVKFWGRLPRLADVYEKLAQADVLVHPAVHEAFGNVCLEGLAAGRPVICLDTGGPALQVTPECGFKAGVGSVEEALEGMAKAMTLLARAPELRLRMGQAARERAITHFHWERKAERMNRFYEEVMQGQKACDAATG
jgi:glycosyltransferase involved in cell wall biosynthesis